uniref:DNA-directed RNA polymerase n=1 Tax=Gloeochaete wittrockiana TaxID=38269 RepID=A0A3G1IVV6_9EUKA|nr:RNA polymerase beta'' subunit [Gloeochaete wittrockiana]ASQ40185.1 RNA polymerase beta'' subunit [Gloeochaete wittrockiana]
MTTQFFSNRRVFYNHLIDKSELKKIVAWSFQSYGAIRTAYLADKVKEFGFTYATKAGISLSLNDLLVPPIKSELLKITEKQILISEKRYLRGEITPVERFQQVIDTWNRTSNSLKREVLYNFRKTDLFNSLYMMTFSGARGNLSQVHQLIGMRGLMSNPQGDIIGIPIRSNFKEGLTSTEYFISSYGARKGLVDTALRTADAGYLTRRLADVVQHIIIREIDCQSQDGLCVCTDDLIIGRVLSKNICHPLLNAKRNEVVSTSLASLIKSLNIKYVWIRSPFTCLSYHSVCQYCYGWNLAHRVLAKLGDAVGIIAAQSIGEPGTQLTMRTFHTGGVFSGQTAEYLVSPLSGIIRYIRTTFCARVRTRYGEIGWVIQKHGMKLVLESDNFLYLTFYLQRGSILYVANNQRIEKFDKLAEIEKTKFNIQNRISPDATLKKVCSDLSGEVVVKIQFRDIFRKLKKKNIGLSVIWVLSGKISFLPLGVELCIRNQDYVVSGSLIARDQFRSTIGGIVQLSNQYRLRQTELKISHWVESAQNVVEIGVFRRLEINEKKIKNLSDFFSFLTEDGIFSLLPIVEKITQETKPFFSHLQKFYFPIGMQINGINFLLYIKPSESFPIMENNFILGESFDNLYLAETGGILLYSKGIRSKEWGKIKRNILVINSGFLFWVPEETHYISKTKNQVLLEGEYVLEGTKLLNNSSLTNTIPGFLRLVFEEDLVKQIVVLPGLLVSDKLSKKLKNQFKKGSILKPGSRLAKKLGISDLRYIDFLKVNHFLFFFTLNKKTKQRSLSHIGRKAILFLKTKLQKQIKSQLKKQRIKSKAQKENWLQDFISNISNEIRMVFPACRKFILLRPVWSYQINKVFNKKNKQKKTKSFSLANLVVSHGICFKNNSRIISKSTVRILRVWLFISFNEFIYSHNLLVSIKVFRSYLKKSLSLQFNYVISVLNNRPYIGCELRKTYFVTKKYFIYTKQLIPPKVLVSQVQILSRMAGKVRGLSESSELSQAMMLVTNKDVFTIPLSQNNYYDKLKVGTLLRFGYEIIPTLILPQSSLVLKKSLKYIRLRIAKPYLIFSNTLLRIRSGDLVEQGHTLATLVFTRMKTSDIVQGLPQIEKFFEAYNSKLELSSYKNPHYILKKRFFLLKKLSLRNPVFYRNLIKAVRSIQLFFLMKIQNIYKSQGVTIDNKHIELIVRQMTTKARIQQKLGSEDSSLFLGQLVDLRQLERNNITAVLTRRKPIEYVPIILGVTKSSLRAESFLSAASFQETIQVLTIAAIEGKSDWLYGLKENIIVGHLIPAGTGFNSYLNLVNNDKLDIITDWNFSPEKLKKVKKEETDSNTVLRKDKLKKIKERPPFYYHSFSFFPKKRLKPIKQIYTPKFRKIYKSMISYNYKT